MNNEYYIDFEWYQKLEKDLIIPTRKEIINTVSHMNLMNKVHNPVEDWQLFSRSINMCRHKYIEKFCFPLLNKEVIDDLSKFLNGKTVLSVCCGTGFIDKCIMDTNPSINIISTDNNKWKPLYRHWKHFVDIETLDAVESVIKYADKIDYVLISWPPYDDDIAFRVLKECIKYKIPIIYIGECEGGCTADYNFFEEIEINCSMEMSITESYIPFDGLYDDIYLITYND